MPKRTAPFGNFCENYKFIIEELENGNVTDEVLSKYSDPDSEEYAKMVEEIRKKLNFTSLQFNRLDDMLDSTGLPHENLCTYCWNGCED